MSHAMLIALLMHHGGSMILPAQAFETDAMGGPDGSFHAVEMTPLSDGTLRLSVVPRPAGNNGRTEDRGR
ncbi:pRL2-19 [Streptomyces marianii]|uniref:PRL2-19 n=2 Tax=Streptomyces marianii TaxID=1817406 RepID=A0A5R9DRA2_9ACTN|nr:pRL2-19 [Streptomyces marianii]